MKTKYEAETKDCYGCPFFHKTYNLIKESESVKIPHYMGRVMETNEHGTMVYLEGRWCDNCPATWDFNLEKTLLPIDIRPCPIEVKE